MWFGHLGNPDAVGKISRSCPSEKEIPTENNTLTNCNFILVLIDYDFFTLLMHLTLLKFWNF